MMAQDRASVRDVSRETSARLATLAGLVRKWSPAINLIAKSTMNQIEERHIADSAQIYDLAPADCRTWVDLGAGAGFPGLVVAALAAESQPDLRMTLVESDQRKAAFLLTAARAMGLDVRVIDGRAEAIAPLNADVVSARALAALPDLMPLAARHLAPGGTALFPKGVNGPAEVEQASEKWRFSCQAIPSRTDPAAVIYRIREIAHA
jgi:16S rRNA (guanine527-N7)-methyltransferase